MGNVGRMFVWLNNDGEYWHSRIVIDHNIMLGLGPVVWSYSFSDIESYEDFGWLEA